ncbi:MAG: anti-sigma factor family protein [Paracoccus hibiscisoli]|uniref:anti-sigma factor family protein n=1 Tax=Paracoccus hibiscisoli TaxID=2023261 RepID=UPI00391B7584
MTIDDETLMALADGQLDPDQARDVQARLATDSAAQARLALFRRTRARLEALRDDIPQAAPGDAALIARIRAATGGAAPRQEATGPAASTIPPRPTAAPPQSRMRAANANRAPWMALAAGLGAVALMAGLALTDGRHDGSPLQTALAQMPAGEGTVLPDGTDLTVLASFRIGGDALCREVETLRDDSARLAVLCRAAPGQPFEERFAMDLPAGDDYRPASGDLEALDDWLTQVGAGPVLSPQEEALLLTP